MVNCWARVHLLLLLLFPQILGAKDLCDVFNWSSCPSDVSSGYSRPSSASNPSSGSAAGSNPGSLSVAQGLGIESIVYDKFDVGITSGNGRVGGALSSQNSEETFFGNIAMEPTGEYMSRIEKRSSYSARKYALAIATRLAGDKRKKYSKKPPKWLLNLGLLAKYNQETDRISPGAGLGLTLGPLNFGISHFYDDYVDSNLNDEKRYRVGFYSAGVKLGAVVLDYSYTEAFAKQRHRIKLLTGSLIVNRLVFSLGRRWESSYRPKYLWEHERWTDNKDRVDSFYGLQYKIGDVLMAGLFFNYYLVHDFSLGLALLF